jgi:UDP-N-acetylmuramyl pentapeptide phosphotransferase/UDP-N-acetylglucosamine-1-phosphate transferase
MSSGMLVSAAGALAAAAWLTGRLCSAGSWLQPVDHPNERSLHARPTPRTGGLAIWGGLATGLAGSVLLEWAGIRIWPVDWPAQAEAGMWIAGMVVLVGAVSFLDDRKSVPAGVRLVIHTLAASGVVIGAGLVVPSLAIPTIGAISLGWFAVPATVLFIVWMANLYNFMDGMDGFAGGMTWLGFGFLSVIAWIGGHALILLLSLLISMAAAGFLFYNSPPARIFMGDVGSVPLGFLAASLAVLGVRDGVFDLWVPVLIFSPFVVDATATLSQRLLRGAKVWQAHREHYYQRLVLAGWSHRRAMLAEYALMLATGATAVLYVHATDPIRLALLLGWAIAYTILAWGVRATERSPGNRVSEAR